MIRSLCDVRGPMCPFGATAKGRLIGAFALVCCIALLASPAAADELAQKLSQLNIDVLPADAESKQKQQRMVPALMSEGIRQANEASTAAWRKIDSREKWETFKWQKIESLAKAVGPFPQPRAALDPAITATFDGDGFTCENLVFVSRPDYLITANLYWPRPLRESVPGIIIQPAHHNPKTQSELQDMGMTFARLGCAVLVMDQVGHGERRAHPFVTDKDYPKPFRVGRQDYYFRYNTGMQLHLIGDSLIGWQAYDLSRGVDLLLNRKRVDKSRIMVMGSVAGGGDPAAVAAALDDRIAAAVIFNFGGPQPETRYPLPDDAEETFGYAGGGSWESTRNISYSAMHGFLPWVIVGSIAPRRLIHAHEFSWDKERDPVWKRYETIYNWHNARDSLAFAHGYGVLREDSSKASHCNNIGPAHRKHIYPALQKWFGIPVPEKEYMERRPSSELLAMTDEVIKARKPIKLHEAAAREAAARSAVAIKQRAAMSPAERRDAVLHALHAPLACLDSAGPATQSPPVPHATRELAPLDGAMLHRLWLQVTEDVVVPAVLLTPPAIPGAKAGAKPPVVVMMSQEGKQALLKARGEAVETLLKSGVAVCLFDPRGTGETKADSGRGRNSYDTSLSATALMLGEPMLAQRLRDLRGVLGHLRSREDIDGKRIGLWGDSLAPVNPADREVRVPHDAEGMPKQCEPLGGLLALIGALHDDSVKAVYVRGGLTGFGSLLESEFIYVPHDVIVPGFLRGGDLCDVAGALAPRPLRMEGLVNARNQLVDQRGLEADYVRTRRDYEQAKATPLLHISAQTTEWAEVARWLGASLK